MLQNQYATVARDVTASRSSLDPLKSAIEPVDECYSALALRAVPDGTAPNAPYGVEALRDFIILGSGLRGLSRMQSVLEKSVLVMFGSGLPLLIRRVVYLRAEK